MQWQPIETAPKDGTWILLRGFELDLCGDPMPPVVAAFWREDDWYEEWAYCFWDSDWRSAVDNPTHWMPLPNPPEQDQRGDGTTTCRWWRDEYGNWCCACSDTMPDFTPWPSADPNGAHCPKCGKAITTKVHDKP